MFFVRTAGERDLEKVRALLAEAQGDNSLKGWNSVASLKALLQQKNSEFLVADSGKEIGGVGYVVMSTDLAKTALLKQICVRPPLQHQGIGRDIFAELETCFPDAEIIRLEVDALNTGAVAFFQAHGFVEVDRIAGPLADGEAATLIVMEKPLPH